MDRREFVKHSAAVSALAWSCSPSTDRRDMVRRTVRRVRPGDPGWPSESRWADLNREVGGRLIKVESPLAACRAPGGDVTSGDVTSHDVARGEAACDEAFRRMRNPFYVGNEPALTQTSGWVDGWTSEPSVFAVAARETADVVAAVDFAREHRLRLVVKGGGHSYQGRSSAPDSLLVWMRGMDDITLHDEFVARGCEGEGPPRSAVTIGGGAIWMDAYDAVTTRGGRYVQGGGCTTVGVAGLVQSGGFGSFSKRFGLAAAGLLEAEVVTADGVVRIANPCTNPELFWALKGGGGGSLGVVTRLTLRTWDLPETFGGVFGRIRATSDEAYRHLIRRVITHYHDRLFTPTWGEQIVFTRHPWAVRIAMVFQGLGQEEATAAWHPLLAWAAAAPRDYVIEQPIGALAAPARRMWDADFLTEYAPGLAIPDDRPDAAPGHFSWAANQDEVGQYLHSYRSAWLPAALLAEGRRDELADALYATARRWTVSLHFNKGLAGAPEAAIEAARDTAMNPDVLDAFALAIVASGGPQAFPGMPNEWHPETARGQAGQVNRAMEELRSIAPDAGSYVSESDYFEADWQRSFWGANYPRLAAVKREYDPDGLFFIHHGVGSEEWSDDGFERVPRG